MSGSAFMFCDLHAPTPHADVVREGLNLGIRVVRIGVKRRPQFVNIFYVEGSPSDVEKLYIRVGGTKIVPRTYALDDYIIPDPAFNVDDFKAEGTIEGTCGSLRLPPPLNVDLQSQ